MLQATQHNKAKPVSHLFMFFAEYGRFILVLGGPSGLTTGVFTFCAKPISQDKYKHSSLPTVPARTLVFA
ncbi:MAG: hypothetical protein ACXV7J_03545, partial [Methylomonas sp.]